MADGWTIETKYQMLFQTMMDAFAAVDLQGRFQEANQAYLDIVNYTHDELRQLNRRDLTPEKWLDVEERIITEQVMVRGYSDVFQKELRRKDGRTVPVELRIALARNAEDKPIGMWAILRDITARIEKEQALLRFQHAVESSPDAVFWVNEEARFPYVNEQACRSLGYSRKELMQLRLWDIDEDFSPSQWDDHWKTVSKARGAHIERKHRRKDGSVFPVEILSNQILVDGQIHHVAYARNIAKRKQADEHLRFFKHAIETAPEGVFLMNQEGGFLFVNNQACSSLGYTPKELLKMHLWDIDPDFPRERWQQHWESMRTVQSRRIETSHRRKDGSLVPVEVMAYLLPFGDKEQHLAFVRDTTERLKAEAERSKLEAQLLQAQKLESVGRLAGGVAHDFNNMLSVISGRAELMQAQIADSDPLFNDLVQIQEAAGRARDLTQQLLAFSRKQIFRPKILEINDLVRGLEQTLSRLIGEDIELLFAPYREPVKIKFDPTQFEQILMNLAVNARDAMPRGGRLTLETDRVVLDEAYCKDHAGFLPGRFACLSVSDNGIGMPEETARNIFEPFFTTKEVGKGTGLGLSTVYGIVKQGGGFINVYSEPDRGTTFTIYIPQVTGKAEPAAATDSRKVEAGAETILLVEDDNMVRTVTRALLEGLGYKVIDAAGPEEALAIFEKVHPAVELLITDVVMPKMDGKELHRNLKAARPDLKVLYMSGYTANAIVHHGVLDKGVQFISKPFKLEELARKVRKILDAQ